MGGGRLLGLLVLLDAAVTTTSAEDFTNTGNISRPEPWKEIYNKTLTNSSHPSFVSPHYKLPYRCDFEKDWCGIASTDKEPFKWDRSQKLLQQGSSLGSLVYGVTYATSMDVEEESHPYLRTPPLDFGSLKESSVCVSIAVYILNPNVTNPPFFVRIESSRKDSNVSEEILDKYPNKACLAIYKKTIAKASRYDYILIIPTAGLGNINKLVIADIRVEPEQCNEDCQDVDCTNCANTIRTAPTTTTRPPQPGLSSAPPQPASDAVPNSTTPGEYNGTTVSTSSMDISETTLGPATNNSSSTAEVPSKGPEKFGMYVGAIAAAVFGTLLVAALAVLLIVILVISRRRRKVPKNRGSEDEGLELSSETNGETSDVGDTETNAESDED